MFHRSRGAIALAGAALLAAATPANAYLYWTMPNFSGPESRGDEPGIGLPMPGATDKELTAHLLWNMRSGLNVAALQCQFAPALMTVGNYNALLRNHDKELTEAYNTLTGYFKRTAAKTWQKSLDQYTTRTYNGFSTLHAQRGFCEVAGSIGRDAIAQPKGKLRTVAIGRMREFRNSLVPQADTIFYLKQGVAVTLPSDAFTATCRDRKGREIACKA